MFLFKNLSPVNERQKINSMCPEWTRVLWCLPLLGPSALMARCPLASWPISLSQSCQPSKGLWVGSLWRELAFHKEPFDQPAYGSVFTWPHLLALMCHKTNAPSVSKKRAGCTSISGISEHRTHARLLVGNGSGWMRKMRMKGEENDLLSVCKEVILSWRSRVNVLLFCIRVYFCLSHGSVTVWRDRKCTWSTSLSMGAPVTYPLF